MNEDALRFNADAYAVAHERMKSAPLDLTDRDFEQLEIVSHAMATEAHRAKGLAILAAAQQPAPDAPKRGQQLRAYFDTTSDDETIAEHCARAPISATPLAYFGKLLAFATDMNAKNIERNTRLDALEQRIKEQDARILELEAQAAAKVNA
jgi:hypothetical protein